MNLYPHQQEATARILEAYASGVRAFLLADEVGLGKTRVACEVAKPFPSVLVVAPLSTFGGWLKESGILNVELAVAEDKDFPVGARILVNYERLHKYPEIATRHWDLIVWDECHKLKGMQTKRFRIFENLLKTRELFMSATPGQNPMELCYLRQVVGFDNFWKWVRAFKGIQPNRRGGLDFRPTLEDSRKLRNLFLSSSKYLRRLPQEIRGWPELQTVVKPVRLTEEQREEYSRAFKDWYASTRAKGMRPDPAVFDLVAVGQFRKRVSALKVGATVELAKDLMEQGRVVVVACEYVEPAKQIASAIGAALITGETPEGERRSILLASAEDKLSAVVITVQEGINLHQVEILHRQRVQIDHDVRWSGIAQHQVDGRTHRAGRNALVYWMVASGTVDERVARVMLKRKGVIEDLTGDSLLKEALSLKDMEREVEFEQLTLNLN